MFVDIHCHLDKNYYENIDQVVNDAKNNGVKKLIYNAVDVNTCKEVLNLIDKYDFIYGALGFHPTELSSITEKDYTFLEENIQNKKIVAIGEIGLDYHYDNTDKTQQKDHFIRQLKLALKYDLPVIIHSRDSIKDTYDILKEYPVKGVLHCYSSSTEMAYNFIKLGIYISVGGILTFKNAKNIKEVIKNIDLSYILLETDSPYLTPEPYRKYQNEPKYIPIIANEVAKIKNTSVSEVRDITTLNACRLFDI